MDELKELHPKARHFCYAYIYGPKAERILATDAGEPSNSAGPPILGQIRSIEVTNTLVVVVRYFGGSKLGVSGLINAYKTAAADALSKVEIVEDFEKEYVEIRVPYTSLDPFLNYTKQKNVVIIDKSFTENCKFKIGLPKGTQIDFLEEVRQLNITLCD